MSEDVDIGTSGSQVEVEGGVTMSVVSLQEMRASLPTGPFDGLEALAIKQKSKLVHTVNPHSYTEFQESSPMVCAYLLYSGITPYRCQRFVQDEPAVYFFRCKRFDLECVREEMKNETTSIYIVPLLKAVERLKAWAEAAKASGAYMIPQAAV